MKKKLNLLDFIKSMNLGHIIKVRYTISVSGRYILYFDYYLDKSRKKYYPGLYLFMDAEHKQRDENIARYVCLLRDRKESDLMSGVDIARSQELDFYKYAVVTVCNKESKNKKLYMASIRSFDGFFPNKAINDVSATDAKRYLQKISALSACTRRHYVRSLSYVFSKAVKDGLIRSNPFSGIKISVPLAKKEFLSENEIHSVIAASCPNVEVKNAFLFSCFTGLRLGDIIALRSNMISGDHLSWKQSKTGSEERILIPEIAKQYLSLSRDYLFVLPAYKSLRANLSALMLSAGITKRITFHCARHTFATLLLSLGVDIYTVSKLLGHSDVRVTQVYAKLVDKIKDQAIQRIDELLL